nr:MAG TPA: hypothetical protein [Bacteriophage sp.]
MAFVNNLPSKSGKPRSDSTQDRWNIEFTNTVNSKTKTVFDLTRYKDFVSKGDKWGHGVINYLQSFRPNFIDVFISNKRTEGGNINYDIYLPDNHNWGLHEFFVISYTGNARKFTATNYINKPASRKTLEEMVHIANAGGHANYINDMPAYVCHVRDYKQQLSFYHDVYDTYLNNEYIDTIRDAGENKITFSGFKSEIYTRYIFSNGEDGYVDTSFGHTIDIPASLRNDPNAWVRFIKNSESESLERTNTFLRESQKIPFNAIKRIKGSYNLGYVYGGTYPLRDVRWGTFDPNNNWYIINLNGSRSGSNVTLRIRYIGNNYIERVVVKNNNTTYTNVSGRATDGWSQVTVNCPDKGLVLELYSGGRKIEAAIHVD